MRYLTGLFVLLFASTGIAADPNTLTTDEQEAGFQLLFNGENLDGWVGNTTDYVVENGVIVIYPDRGGKGNLFTAKEYENFILKSRKDKKRYIRLNSKRINYNEKKEMTKAISGGITIEVSTPAIGK